MTKCKNFIKNNAVMCIALIAAIITIIIIPVDKAYLDYFDYKTLTCLFCVLAVVCALKNINFLHAGKESGASIQECKNECVGIGVHNLYRFHVDSK